MIWQEIEKIEETMVQAVRLVEQGKFKKAEILAKRLRNSMCVSEATRASTVIRAYIEYMQGKNQKAIQIVKDNLGYCWSSPDAFFILRSLNPLPDKDTCCYKIILTGAWAALGAFTAFPPDYMSTFDVLANSPEEAVDYVKALGCYPEPETLQLLHWEKLIEGLEDADNRGIYRAHPFSRGD